MKIVFEPGEKERIRNIHDEYDHRLFDEANPERIYSLRFKVTDPAIAQYALSKLLYRPNSDMDLGISCTEIRLRPAPDADDVKLRLHQAIDEIFS